MKYASHFIGQAFHRAGWLKISLGKNLTRQAPVKSASLLFFEKFNRASPDQAKTVIAARV
jgi:hypothetical protein